MGNLRKINNTQDVIQFPRCDWFQNSLRKLNDIIQGMNTWLWSVHTVLEQPSSWSTSRIHPSWPRSWLRLSLLLAFHSTCIPCCHAPFCILLFVPNGSGFTLPFPSLLSGWLLTNVQVSNTTKLYDTHRHAYIHHISITILLSNFLLTLPPSLLAGRLA